MLGRSDLGSALLHALARFTAAAPKLILATALLLMAVAAVVGAPVSHKVSTAGFADLDAESAKVTQLLADDFHIGGDQLILLVRAPKAIDAAAPHKVVDQIVGQLKAADNVATVTSPWDSPNPVATGQVSRDKRSALVVVGLQGGQSQSATYAAELARRFTGDRGDGITVLAGGQGFVSAEISDQARRDLALSEAIALPISFAVLVWVFGGLLAALIPLTVGCFAIVGSMAILRLLAEVTNVSAFALNVSAGMGLALAIDYSLLIVSRYREEIEAGAEPRDAIGRTMQTAGRTVAYSAVTVGLCLAATALFPMYALRSLAYGGVAVVVLAALASLIVAPAIILITAKRISKKRVSHQRARTFGTGGHRS